MAAGDPVADAGEAGAGEGGRTGLLRLVVRLKYWLILLVILVCLLGNLLARPEHGQPHAARWELASEALGEVAAALVGALATIFLVDATNKQELRESIERHLRAELVQYRTLGEELRREMRAQLGSLRGLGEDFRTDMQSAELYKAFCYWPDRAMVENLNRRIFANPLIRTRQEITCAVLKSRDGQPPGTVDMRFAYVIQYQNLADTPETKNVFELSLDEAVVIDPLATIEYIDVAVFSPGKSTPEKIHHVALADLRVDMPAGDNRVFRFTVGSNDPCFTVERGRLLEWRYAYVARQPCQGYENFVLRELTSYFVFAVEHEHHPDHRFALQALTDAPGPWACEVRRGAGLRLEITDMLLPRQGIAFSWDLKVQPSAPAKAG